MSNIKTWEQRSLELGIGSCEARDEELIDIRSALSKAEQELEDWRFTNKIDELQRSHAALQEQLNLALGTIESRDRNIAATVAENQELRSRVLALVNENKEPQAGPLSEEAYDIAQSQIMALQAKLTALEGQEPVTYWDLTENEPPIRPSKFLQEEHPNHQPLYAAAGAAPVPEGWQLVPVEPTDQMLLTAHDGPLMGSDYDMSSETKKWLIDMYKAMLAAAPRSAS